MSRGAPGLAVPLRAERGLAVFAERLQPVRDMRVDAEEPVVLPVVLVPVLQVQVVPERVLQVSVVPVPVVLVPVLVPVRHQSEAALGRPDLPRAYVGPAARSTAESSAVGTASSPRTSSGTRKRGASAARARDNLGDPIGSNPGVPVNSPTSGAPLDRHTRKRRMPSYPDQ